MQRHPGLAGEIRAFLQRDHARIEGLHARLMDDLDGERTGDRAELWRRFEAAVLGHMAIEERYLLRAFGRGHRQEAAALLTEHARLRRALAEIPPDLASHRAALARFVEGLHLHARREDTLLYAWADAEVDGATRQRITRDLAQLANTDAPLR